MLYITYLPVMYWGNADLLAETAIGRAVGYDGPQANSTTPEGFVSQLPSDIQEDEL